ncbi:MAG: protein kinase, partial [Phycisphaerae bacterium]|nr:protein kinase [Phycisphaerae bacterium]
KGLKREAAIALKLSHQSICRLHTFHSDGDIKFLVMEYIEGRTLEELIGSKADRKLAIDELLPIARDVAEALDLAHSQPPPVLHRDIKPSNIMVTPDGRAKVLDFGIARELKDSFTRVTGRETSGTLLYMSPEQFSGKTPTAASDIYSFAATLYECLSGHPPFWQGSIGHQLLNMQPGDIPDVPEHVNAALRAGLSKNPSERPSGARELVGMLAAKVRAQAVPVRKPVAKSQRASNEPRVAQPPQRPSRVRSAVIAPQEAPKPAAQPRSRHMGLWVFLVLCAVGIGIIAVVTNPSKKTIVSKMGPPKTLTLNLGGGVAMKFVLIPAGKFIMGSPQSEKERDNDESPQHEVAISKTFYM